MSPALPIAFALIGLALPAMAGTAMEGDWDCKAGRETVGRLAIDGAGYRLDGVAGTLGARGEDGAVELADGPLVETWHLSRLLLDTTAGAEALRLQVTAMYAPRSIGSCSRPAETSP
jgi:hypothetical protein